MKKNKLIIIILAASLTISLGLNLYPAKLNSIKNEIITDHKMDDLDDDLSFSIPNKNAIVGIYHNEGNYLRLNEKDKENVRSEVWSLSKNSSGVQIHFSTDSPTISVRLSLENYGNMGNMNNVGKNGVDLYCWKNNNWQFVDSGIPNGENNIFTLGKNLKQLKQQYILNLPLYNTVKKVEIGIQKKSTITFGSNFKKMKPIVFYGTSITQGASASRPGMAYTNIISRNLNQQVYNLGFSGNGLFEKSVAKILCKMNPEIYVIDCTPNSSPEIIKKNAFDFIELLHQCKPNTPILLIESVIREEAYFNSADKNTFGGINYINAQNNELRKVFNKASEKGIKNIFYLSGENLIGQDHEATVDGTHLTDLGMFRIANQIENKINQIFQQ